MFNKSALFYDKIYAFKDYRGEAEKVTAIIRERGRSGGRRLLDVACGTGKHLECFQEHFDVEGLDLDGGLLEIAQQRLPGAPLHQADMENFTLAGRFDAITCLFSAIGYLKTLERVSRACRTMADHLLPGGVLVIEPWLTPGIFHAGHVAAELVDEPELKVARVTTSMVAGRLSYFDFHYLVATPQGTEHMVERHELGLFTPEEMRTAVESAGLSVTYDEQGLTGRGLWIGVKPD
jgi:SAM-dependent methyltransferase